ncbi:pyridine nucleotide-disulfide oxidoreductase [Halobacteriovorax marinus]|uniref:FAD-dependent oxidoreductase n=1 Tax=Halobacteriovorax marinus TaxID=97084 RepID=UPI000BC2F385|nr:bifunctional TVP38/TMEM64 family protein/FAD-dependent oxidoreductase [Halobacteriovorax marinus]ATH06789.1 pyridine nucleotide-disulfide oxidoreductase [Halobacteriovorax marinus]
MKKNSLKITLLLFIIALFAITYKFNLTQYLSIDFLKENREALLEYYRLNPSKTIISYFLIYTLSTALSIPGAVILTLGGGAIFGTFKGTLIVSFASTIGATLSFLAARFLLRDFVQNKFHTTLDKINRGIEKDGHLYLLSLRLIPAFPFFLINLLMGLTKIKMLTYFFISQIGMLLGTLIYVNAGSQLSTINSANEVFQAKTILSFSLLAIFPFLAKKLMNVIRKKKIYKRFRKPKKYDYNMVAIGGGAAGLVTSYIGAAVKAKVALIEREKMGGDCLNTGCVPSKALIKSAKAIYQAKNAHKYGIESVEVKYDFKTIMNRVHSVIKKIEPHDSVQRYSDLGVDCISGNATILSPWEIQIGERVITTKNITIATGARPFIPAIKGIDQVDYLSSDNIWKLEELPKNFTVIGGGPIGVELAQSFQRLGSKVSLVEMSDRILAKEDEDVSELILNQLKEEGIQVYLNSTAKEFKGHTLIIEKDKQDISIEFDKVLLAIGRTPNTQGLNLEELGVSLRKNGTIETNEFLESSLPNIYACGDVAGPYQLTHTASHQAWYCAVNGLFGALKKFKVDYSSISWTTYSDPEVATVGKNESACKIEGIQYDVSKFELSELDRAIADSEELGFVKVLTKPGSDKIIGATIVSSHASDLIIEFTSAMKNGFGLNKILSTMHVYPSLGEANKYLAGVWKKKNQPHKLLALVSKYHSWLRK